MTVATLERNETHASYYTCKIRKSLIHPVCLKSKPWTCLHLRWFTVKVAWNSQRMKSVYKCKACLSVACRRYLIVWILVWCNGPLVAKSFIICRCRNCCRRQQLKEIKKYSFAFVGLEKEKTKFWIGFFFSTGFPSGILVQGLSYLQKIEQISDR